MRPTRTLTGNKAREALYRGVNAIYDVVKSTFGPEGTNALLYRTMNRGNRITNDGVTVAECQEPKDIHVRMAAQTFKEACKRTAEKVGDGTTGTIIIAGKLFNDLYKILDESHNAFAKSSKRGVMTLKREILAAAEHVKKQIKAAAKQIESLEELERIATISVEDADLGKTIAAMAYEVGIDGYIDVVEGYKGEIETEVIKGMRFPAKVAAKAFVNNLARYEMMVKNCAVIVTNYDLENAAKIASMFSELNKTVSEIAIIAPSFSSNMLVNFANACKSGYTIYPVAAPSLRTDQFEDLAVYCGAKFIDKTKGHKLENCRPQDLGQFEKMVVKDSDNKEDAVITGGKGTFERVNEVSTLVDERIEILKGQLLETKQEKFKKLLERRIASMASAVGIIRVGDSTQASSLYRKLKIEDAVYACKAALRGGYVPGAGICLKMIAEDLPDEHILKSALLAPYEQIQNSVDGGVEIGVDVIDPAEAIFYAVEHATQVVANLITVSSITAEEEDVAPGEGEFAMARAMTEFVISDKIQKGQLREGEEEAYRDSLGGMSAEEYGIINRD